MAHTVCRCACLRRKAFEARLQSHDAVQDLGRRPTVPTVNAGFLQNTAMSQSGNEKKEDPESTKKLSLILTLSYGCFSNLCRTFAKQSLGC